MFNIINPQHVCQNIFSQTLAHASPYVRIASTIAVYETAKILIQKIYNFAVPVLKAFTDFLQEKKEKNFDKLTCQFCIIEHDKHIKMRAANCFHAHVHKEPPAYDENVTKT